MEPEVKWIGNIHGDEILGRELLINFAIYLCQSWVLKTSRISNLIETTRIHILPTMNPDGHARAVKIREPTASISNNQKLRMNTGRNNAYNIDLNRSFPDLTTFSYLNSIQKYKGPNNHLSIPSTYNLEGRKTIVPETVSVIYWIKRYPFVLSAQLHGGALVANYPFDHSNQSLFESSAVHSSNYAKSPDDETFRYFASLYATKHKTMSSPTLNLPCPDAYENEDFGVRGGITNGAEWYEVKGGMQDFNYLHTNCFELTLELGCQKYTNEEDLEVEWDNNIESLLSFTEAVKIGIKGIVQDEMGQPIGGANIKVNRILSNGSFENIDHDITTTNLGEFWRVLTRGDYSVFAATRFRKSEKKNITIVKMDEAIRVDFIIKS